MQLSALVSAVNKASKIPTRTHSFLFYGMPKTGKTELVATVAEAPEFERIFWFDCENGFETLLRMYKDGKLSQAALDKIILIRIPDTREDPTACETMLKAICTKSAVTICDEHGKVDCAVCKRVNAPVLHFDYRKLTRRDAMVIDSMSQVGQSSLNMACLGKPAEFKLTFDEYGASGKWLGDICTVIQAAAYCHIFAITHVQIMEDENKNDIYYPLCGTKNFSASFAKFFGSVVYVSKKLKKHRAESSTTTSTNTVAGSRLGLCMEKGELDLVRALRETGFLSPEGATTPEYEEHIKAATEAETAPTQEPTKPVSRFGAPKN